MPGRVTSPELSAAQRQLVARLDGVEDLASYLIARDEQRRDLLWDTADVLSGWVTAHLNGGPVTPLYKSLAAATGWSSRFVRDLVRTAAAFPPEVREQYADKAWSFFAECLREGDPLAAAARYADLSVRQIRDYRRTRKQSAKEPGYLKLSVTLRPDHVETLRADGRVTVSTVLQDFEEADVTIVRRARDRGGIQEGAVAALPERPGGGSK